jgi:hypothetical protein
MNIDKSLRDIDIKFNLQDFNKDFEKNLSKKTNFYDEEYEIKYNNTNEIPPHKRSIEQLIIDARNIFYKILDLIINKQNPLEFILSSPTRLFVSSILIIIIGCLLLLLSGLMI